MAFNPEMFTSGLGGVLGGIFGNSGDSYDKAMQQYNDWTNKSANTQQPFYNAGTGAIKNYQDWLNSQKNPTEFINKTMQDYKESPYAHYMQQQGLFAGQNAASASGLIGSTPLMQSLQQNAENISSQDQNQWLQNVLGINTQYGQGQQNLINGGQNSANSLSNLYNQQAQRMGEAAYGKNAGQKQDLWNTIGGGLSLIGSYF